MWAEAAAYCAGKGKSLEKLALQYSLQNNQIHTTLVGSASAENMKRNVRWLGEAVDEELLSEVLEILKPIKDGTWLVGRPENSQDFCGFPIRIFE